MIPSSICKVGKPLLSRTTSLNYTEKSGAIFSLIIVFEKKTVPLTKPVPKWSHFPEKVENGTTFQKVELFCLHCGAVLAPLWSHFSKKKDKKRYHLIKSGAVLKTVPICLRWYYFWLQPATVSRKWYHCAKEVPTLRKKRCHFGGWN